MTHRRDEIEKFCRNFLHGNSGQQQGNYEREFSQIDIQQLFLKDTFDGSFQSVCNDGFTHRPASNGYIIAIPGFTQGSTQTALLFFVVYYSYSDEFVS